MKLSDVFYEAACRMSEQNVHESSFSCHLISQVANNDRMNLRSSESTAYSDLMTESANDVEYMAREIGWSASDFRTFMLLMASEATK